MPVRLPLVPTIPSYRVGTALADVQYILDVRWNERDAAWYLDVLAEDETPLRVGIRVVLGAMLGGRSVHPGFPAGLMIAADLTDSGHDAGLDDLGARVVINFYTVAELQELIA